MNWKTYVIQLSKSKSTRAQVSFFKKRSNSELAAVVCKLIDISALRKTCKQNKIDFRSVMISLILEQDKYEKDVPNPHF